LEEKSDKTCHGAPSQLLSGGFMLLDSFLLFWTHSFVAIFCFFLLFALILLLPLSAFSAFAIFLFFRYSISLITPFCPVLHATDFAIFLPFFCHLTLSPCSRFPGALTALSTYRIYPAIGVHEELRLPGRRDTAGEYRIFIPTRQPVGKN